MSSFKNLLKSDTPTASSDSSTGRAALAGQGSHFPKSNDPPFATRAADDLGSTATGTEPHTLGPSDISAAPAPVSQARATAGPEAGGSGHIGTTSAVGSSGLSGDRTSAPSSATPASTTYSFPTTLRSGQNTSSAPTAASSTGQNVNTGTAAVGETTTYSSRPLGSGDPTGSVVDHKSTDPLTYKIPEAGSHHQGPGTDATPASSSGVTSSAAATAASLAWSAQNKDTKMPGEFPSDGNENPYRASNLDPRVDGGALGSSTSQPSSSLPSRTRESDLTSTGPAPSTLTTTTDPTDRSAQYASSVDNKGLGTTSSPAAQSQSTPVATAEAGQQQSVIGRTLGAIGLGGAASTAAGYLGYGAKSDSTEEPRDTSAVATQPGMVSQETGPPKHYRRESIPTTAYPGGPNSPRAVAPPVGGTADARQSVDQGLSGSNTNDRFGNERGIGGTAATTAGVAAAGTGFGLGSATSGVPKQEYSESSNVRDTVGSGTSGQTRQSEPRDTAQTSSRSGDDADKNVGSPGTATADAIDAGAFPTGSSNKEAEMLGDVNKDPATVGGASGNVGSGTTSDTAPQTSSSHTGRDIAAGGAAAAATGAGAHSLQHHERSEDLRSSAAEDATRQQPTGAREETLSGGHSYTITGGHDKAPVDAISSRDPNDRSSTSRDTGLGSSSSPNAPIDAVAAAPGRYDSQDYNQRSLGREESDSHTGRNAALGAGAAAAGAGGLAYASRDHGQHGSVHDATTIAPGSTGATTTTGQTPSASSAYGAPQGTSSGYGTTSGTSASQFGSRDTSTGYGTAGQTTSGSSAYGAPQGTSSGYGTTSGTSVPQSGARDTSTGYGTTGTTTHDVTTTDQTQQRQDDHTGRNVGLGAGAAAAGGAAYAAHEHSNDRELEKQREADAKEAAKREKEHQKEQEKEEKHHRRELEKEEKKHEKEEKKHDKEDKEAAAAAEKREKARLAAEEEDRKRREREAAAGVGTAGAVGAEEQHHEKEKKPSIFKRIFKRRKNKDTGEDEDYSSDDEEDKARHGAAGSSVPVHHSQTKDRNVLGSSRDETAAGTTTGTGLTSETGDRPRESITGLEYDPSKDPAAAARLSQNEPNTGLTGTGAGTGVGTGIGHETGTGTGIGHETGTGTGTGTGIGNETGTGAGIGAGTGTGSHGILGSEPLGEIGDSRR